MVALIAIAGAASATPEEDLGFGLGSDCSGGGSGRIDPWRCANSANSCVKSGGACPIQTPCKDDCELADPAN